MRPTTSERHKRIREQFYLLVGTMPLTEIYLQLAEQFGMSDDYIRQICRKKAGASFRLRKERPPPRMVIGDYLCFFCYKCRNSSPKIPKTWVYLHRISKKLPVLSNVRIGGMYSIKNVLLRMGNAKARVGGTTFFDE